MRDFDCFPLVFALFYYDLIAIDSVYSKRSQESLFMIDAMPSHKDTNPLQDSL